MPEFGQFFDVTQSVENFHLCAEEAELGVLKTKLNTNNDIKLTHTVMKNDDSTRIIELIVCAIVTYY